MPLPDPARHAYQIATEAGVIRHSRAAQMSFPLGQRFNLVEITRPYRMPLPVVAREKLPGLRVVDACRRQHHPQQIDRVALNPVIAITGAAASMRDQVRPTVRRVIHVASEIHKVRRSNFHRRQLRIFAKERSQRRVGRLLPGPPIIARDAKSDQRSHLRPAHIAAPAVVGQTVRSVIPNTAVRQTAARIPAAVRLGRCLHAWFQVDNP